MPAASLSGDQKLRIERVAKLRPHLLTTDFLWFTYDEYTNPLDLFWAMKSSYSLWDAPRPHLPVLQNCSLEVVFPEWLPKTWHRWLLFPFGHPQACSATLACFPGTLWLSWDRSDPGTGESLHSANLDKFPLNPESSPLTVRGSEGHVLESQERVQFALFLLERKKKQPKTQNNPKPRQKPAVISTALFRYRSESHIQ